MSAWPSKLARRALYLLRNASQRDWSLVREFIHIRTGGRFHLLSDLLTADLTGQEDADRQETVQAVVTALESHDASMLIPENTFVSKQ